MHSDYHVHCDHSPDCQTSMESQLRSAREKGISDLCFTDHLELGLEEWGDIEIDLQAYRREFDRLKREYPEINLRFGIEAGISCPMEHFERLKRMMRSMDFDFVIASAHTVEGKNVLKDIDYRGDGLARACREYIPSIIRRLKLIDPESYSSIGHIDFPLKGALRCLGGTAEYKYTYAPDEMDELFRYIIDMGKCLELNVSPWALMPENMIKVPDWLVRYAQLGGEYITIGSDSHRPENTGMYFREAVEIAREAGVKYLAVYRNMKPEFHMLSKI